MPKSLSWRKLVKKLKRVGFVGPISGGRHLLMQKGDFKVSIPNPHRGDLSKGLVAEILREIDIDQKEWENL
jgi:predicted RNA binding protein YcfA (HicA-like mRNA interferase family)